MARYKTRRARAAEVSRSRVRGRKGLTADGSTRAWRRLRDATPGKPRRCPDGSKPFLDHKVARKDGGKDTPGNVRWMCGRNPNVGRPRGS